MIMVWYPMRDMVGHLIGIGKFWLGPRHALDLGASARDGGEVRAPRERGGHVGAVSTIHALGGLDADDIAR